MQRNLAHSAVRSQISSVVKAEKRFVAPCMWCSILLQAMRPYACAVLYQVCMVTSGGIVECGSKSVALITSVIISIFIEIII